MNSTNSSDAAELPARICQRCQRQTGGRSFRLGGETRCFRCALYYVPMLQRSLLAAVVVGTFLTAINQGNLLVHGDVPSALYWKIPLTYCVPFLVATWGALSNASRRSPTRPAP